MPPLLAIRPSTFHVQPCTESQGADFGPSGCIFVENQKTNAVEMVRCCDWKGVSACIRRSYLLQKCGKALSLVSVFLLNNNNNKKYCIHIFIIKDESSVHGCTILQETRNLSCSCQISAPSNLSISDGGDRLPKDMDL